MNFLPWCVPEQPLKNTWITYLYPLHRFSTLQQQKTTTPTANMQLFYITLHSLYLSCIHLHPHTDKTQTHTVQQSICLRTFSYMRETNSHYWCKLKLFDFDLSLTTSMLDLFASSSLITFTSIIDPGVSLNSKESQHIYCVLSECLLLVFKETVFFKQKQPCCLRCREMRLIMERKFCKCKQCEKQLFISDFNRSYNNWYIRLIL